MGQERRRKEHQTRQVSQPQETLLYEVIDQRVVESWNHQQRCWATAGVGAGRGRGVSGARGVAKALCPQSLVRIGVMGSLPDAHADVLTELTEEVLAGSEGAAAGDGPGPDAVGSATQQQPIEAGADDAGFDVTSTDGGSDTASTDRGDPEQPEANAQAANAQGAAPQSTQPLEPLVDDDETVQLFVDEEPDLEGFDEDGAQLGGYGGYGGYGGGPQAHADEWEDDEVEYAEDYDEEGNLTKYVYDFNSPGYGGDNGPGMKGLVEILREEADMLENLTIVDGTGRFTEEQVVDFGEWLASNEVLETLDMIDCIIGERGWRAIGDALLKNQYLDELSIEGQGFGEVCIEEISWALSANQSFPSMLCLSVGAGTLSSSAWRSFAEALKATTLLSSLILCDNDLSGAGFHFLSQGLALNSSLKHISISACCVDAKGA